MSQPDPLSYATTSSLSAEAVRAQLQISWQSGHKLRLEELLLNVPLDEWEDSLCLLVKTEWELRQQAGDLPGAEEYLKRFPTSKRLPIFVQTLPTAATNSEPFKTVVWPTPAIHQLDLPTQTGSEFSAISKSGLADDLQRYLEPPRHPDELGRLGPYILRKLLGQGGMGAVFAATDPQLDRTVAIKLLNPSISMMPLARQRFLREARVMAALHHEHIVPLYQIFDGQEGLRPLYLVMPLLQGETLEAKLTREKRLSLVELVQIFREVLSALAVTHAIGIVHRDIKPANIWLETLPELPGKSRVSSFRVRVLDFGLARDMEAPGLTSTGFYLGTPGYSAPEQVEGRKIDGRADLFSLGSVLYQAAVGDRVFKGPTISEVLKSVMSMQPTPLHQRRTDYPEPLTLLIDQMLQKDPNQRPASAVAILKELEGLHPAAHDRDRTQQLHESWATNPQSGRAPSRGQFLLMMFVLVFLIGLAIGVYFWPRG